MTNQIEFADTNGRTAALEGDRFTWLGSDLAVRFGASLPDGRLKSAVQFLANENSYDPRTQFLERCVEEHEPSEGINSIATDYFGNESEIANLAMKRMMIGAVARAYNPGCSMSWLPILIGAQGRGKSQWAKSLVPTEMFSEMNSDLHTLIKEAYRLHTGWILELPEIDQFFKPQNAEVLKNLITLQVDEIRRPYELPTKAKRGFIFLGTSNEPQLLVDSTGNRRFVPIRLPNDHVVPWRKLKDERGSLWAAAVKLYREHEPWEYTSGQLAELATYQDDFLERDSWYESISSYISDKKDTTTSNILQYAINIPLDRVNNGHQRRVGRVMRSLGWEYKQTKRTIDGKRKSVRLWLNPEDPKQSASSDF
ncbi:VapE domain-containing protein [Synechococcus sp. BIOS-E4-1]|uniref:VapE domain-containing protein n=1 Tax=Synechococcus sp. BIOS-E4-1 TaxID=1400864 RepID=UPI0016489323|nr:VapE domain-containing protein [Synechococcus sp. BIOS-E4-1]